jgi:hypothetical protein
VYRTVTAALLALLFCSTAAAQDSSAHDALALFRKMQAALGGADKIAAIRDYEEQDHAEIFDPKGKSLGEVQKRTRWIRPNYLRLDQIGPFDTYALYFDGRSGWEILPDKSVKELVGSELQFAQDYLRGLDLNVWLADRDPHRRITSPEPNVIRIAKANDKSDFTEVLLDPISGLPLRNGSISPPDPTHPAHSGMRFEGWMTVRGVKFPSRRANFHDGARLAEITADSIIVNGGLKQSDLAAKPSDLKPVLRRPKK